jgi:hypothetical protein
VSGSFGLNLLPSSAKFQAERVRWQKGVKIYWWFLGIVWLVLVLVVFGWWLIVKYGLVSLEKKYQRVLGSYRSLAGEVWGNERLKYKTKIVGETLVGRFEYGSTIKKMDELFPSQKIRIGDFELVERKKFLVKGEIDDGPNLDELEARILEINRGESELFKKASLLSLGLIRGFWNFELEVELK